MEYNRKQREILVSLAKKEMEKQKLQESNCEVSCDVHSHLSSLKMWNIDTDIWVIEVSTKWYRNKL